MIESRAASLTVINAPSGPASGALTGTYPSPGLADGVVTPAKLSGVGPTHVGADVAGAAATAKVDAVARAEALDETPVFLALCAGDGTDLTSQDVMGGPVVVDPANYTVSSRTVTYSLVAVASLSAGGFAGVLELVKAPGTVGETIVATINVPDGTTTATAYSQNFTAPVAATVYELRARRSGGIAGQKVFVGSGHVRVRRSA